MVFDDKYSVIMLTSINYFLLFFIANFRKINFIEILKNNNILLFLWSFFYSSLFRVPICLRIHILCIISQLKSIDKSLHIISERLPLVQFFLWAVIALRLRNTTLSLMEPHLNGNDFLLPLEFDLLSDLYKCKLDNCKI